MKITVESVLSTQYDGASVDAFGDLYLNGELMAWIGFMSKVELEAEPGENTIEIFFENAENGRAKIKFYATEDVHIFIRFRIKVFSSNKLVVYTLAKGKDLKIIEQSGIEE